MTPLQKAQKINLDEYRYGSFAEIGAGQEVVRLFFQASGTSGTVSKSISAYDMEVSDNIYGECNRYVCRDRLEKMLDRESRLTLERLGEKEGSKKAFFSFANTVSARNYKGTNHCHGWMGVDFQNLPREKFNRIVVHFNLYDDTNLLQQEIVGILGVNLLDAAFYYNHSSQIFLRKLFEGLNSKRVEVDLVDFSGPSFVNIDNRLIPLHLVNKGLSRATLFNPSGHALLYEEFYKKNIVVERGAFYPITNLHLDIIQSSIEKYREIYQKVDIFPIMEISMRNIFQSSDVHRNLEMFLERTDILCATGANVLITDYPEYYRLVQYLQKNTTGDISICLGVNSIKNIFNEKYYHNLEGGLLESLGRMFKKQVRVFVYPYKNILTGELTTLSNLKIGKKHNDLLQYFKKQKYFIELDNYKKQYLGYNSEYIVKLINENNSEWKKHIPEILVDKIKIKDFLL